MLTPCVTLNTFSVEAEKNKETKTIKIMKQLTTPIGTAYYPKLTQPDTKFNSDGVYSCKLILSKDDFEKFSAIIDPWFEKEYERLVKESGKKKLDRSPKLPLKLNNDNEYEVFAKQVAQRETSKGLLKFDVALFDSSGKKINNPPNIGSGSKLRLGVEPSAWFSPMMGVGYTLRLKAAQIIELKEYEGGAGGFSFDAQEGGFVSEDLGDAFENDSKDASIPF
jgi:hypothetical protein